MSLLSESDAIWAADQFIEYYSKFNRIDDYMRFVKQSRIQNSSGKLFGPEEEIFSNFSVKPNDMSFTIHEVAYVLLLLLLFSICCRRRRFDQMCRFRFDQSAPDCGDQCERVGISPV